MTYVDEIARRLKAIQRLLEQMEASGEVTVEDAERVAMMLKGIAEDLRYALEERRPGRAVGPSPARSVA